MRRQSENCIANVFIHKSTRHKYFSDGTDTEGIR